MALVLACGSTAPDQARWPSGNFAAPLFDGNAYLAVSLRESGGMISGAGWSSIDDSMLGGATVTGSYTVPGIHLELQPRLGGGLWLFNGTLDSLTGTLTGEFAVAPGTGFSVVLQPVDTIPTGIYDVELNVGTRMSLTGSAGFHYLFTPPRLFVVLRTQGTVSYHTGFAWNGAGRPEPGTYGTSVSDPAGFSASLQRVSGTGIEATYALAPGILTVEISDRYVLTGHFTLTATDPATSMVLTLRGRFSAGCVGNRC